MLLTSKRYILVLKLDPTGAMSFFVPVDPHTDERQRSRPFLLVVDVVE